MPEMKLAPAILRRSALAAMAMAAAAMVSAHGCSKPCGDVGLECCDLEQCQDALVCLDSTCAVAVRRDAGTPPPVDAGCGGLGLGCCGGTCLGSLVCGPGDRCIVGPDLGTGCARNSECDERLCLPVEPSSDAGRNVCTTVCNATAVCPAGWRCGPYPGVSLPICLCRAAPESCNGLDDDCDGVIDGPAAQDWCAASDAGNCVDAGCMP